MVQSVVIDANIFFHMWILNSILTLADEGLFEPLWSDAIMEEVSRNLPKVWKEVSVSQISSFLAVVNESYPYAKVPDWHEHMEGLELPDPTTAMYSLQLLLRKRPASSHLTLPISHKTS